MTPTNDWQRYEDTKQHVREAQKLLVLQRKEKDRDNMVGNLLGWCYDEITKLQNSQGEM